MVQVPVLAIHGGAGAINRKPAFRWGRRARTGPSVHSGERAGRAGRGEPPPLMR